MLSDQTQLIKKRLFRSTPIRHHLCLEHKVWTMVLKTKWFTIVVTVND
jgi:hypothetical protein